MLVRLLLALLLASFAVPAAAAVPACHDGAMAGMADHPAPEQQAPDHVCVGCVPLADWLGARVAPRILPPDRRPASRVIRLDLGGIVAPTLRPPRHA
ncbi:hypothetical protein [Sphingomonas rubra]|uniref:DUF2946 domain-containing protein n=1 Tax=Sphingomonas rubra TaxID=634430 RepID=A0A1I5UF92_9SPHN|nr:hypothetical protein [Sphingomonas rubra]SFP93922.1 hypothetical protein SAMN04488241_111135 [Sphingomonas rubra]